MNLCLRKPEPFQFIQQSRVAKRLLYHLISHRSHHFCQLTTHNVPNYHMSECSQSHVPRRPFFFFQGAAFSLALNRADWLSVLLMIMIMIMIVIMIMIMPIYDCDYEASFDPLFMFQGAAFCLALALMIMTCLVLLCPKTSKRF